MHFKFICDSGAPSVTFPRTTTGLDFVFFGNRILTICLCAQLSAEVDDYDYDDDDVNGEDDDDE